MNETEDVAVRKALKAWYQNWLNGSRDILELFSTGNAVAARMVAVERLRTMERGKGR